jgi:glutamate racemase
MKTLLSNNPSAHGPIGVFDSGVGGLSVLKELERLLPQEQFVFLADQSHVPYGGKTGRQLERLSSRITRFLLEQRCKVIVVACNTATCYAIKYLRSHFSVPFIGTVPAVKPACEATQSGVVAVLSTPATAQSSALQQLVKQYGRGVRVLCVGCPGLEDLVERGGLHNPAVEQLVATYLQPALDAGADHIVLGCTHYPFLKNIFHKLGAPRTIDSGRAIAKRTKAVLAESSLLARRRAAKTSFYTTGPAQAFSRVASELLGRRVRGQHVTL